MAPCNTQFAKVFFILAAIRNSDVFGGSIRPTLSFTTTTPHLTYSVNSAYSPNATATSYIPQSTHHAGGSSAGQDQYGSQNNRGNRSTDNSSAFIDPSTQALPTAPITTTPTATLDVFGGSIIPTVSFTTTTPHLTYSVNSAYSPNATTTTYIPQSTQHAGRSSAGTQNNRGNPSTDNSGNSADPSTQTSSTAPPTTTPTPTREPTTPDPCDSASKPKNLDQCQNETCARKYLEQMEFYINCGKTDSKTYFEHVTNLTDIGEKLALSVSADIKAKVRQSEPVNTTTVISTNEIAIGASIIFASSYSNTSRGVFYFPNISIEGLTEKLGSRAANSILYPKRQLPIRNDIVQVAWSISEARQTTVPKEEIEPHRDNISLLPVADMKIHKNQILINKVKPNLKINSPVISFSLHPKPGSLLDNRFQIIFRRLKNDRTKNHGCYFWSKTFWSSIGCSVVQNNESHTVCSYHHMSIFVVLSEVHDEADEDARNAVRIVAIVFCILAMAAIVATIQMTRKLDCFDNDRVFIHINLCIVMLIGYVLFIIGVIESDIAVLNDILVVALHFCQLSPFVWLCLEGFYFLNTIYPIFDYENTNTKKMYTSLGWALTAAFAGATAGYERPHHGKPFNSEIVWVFINKATCAYFFGPLLTLFVINICIRVGLVVHVVFHSQKNDTDKTPLRIKVNLLTTLVLATVVFLAWYFGVQAVNNTESKGYHYSFILLYCFQALLVFIIYGWQNEEMRSLHEKRKEKKRREEERTVTFNYVP